MKRALEIIAALGIIILALLISSVSVKAQDVIYATNTTSDKITKITANANSGATTGNFTTVENIERPSAALGASAGYLYYLGYGDGGNGEGNGKVHVYSVKNDGTGNDVYQASLDVNGSSNNELGFVRLAISKNGIGWILAKESSTNKLYLAKFTANSNGTVSNFVFHSIVTTSDNADYLFSNGDLAFDGKGVMYALANNGTTTKIYTIDPTSSNTLTYKWTLKTSTNSNFDGRVSGVAFSSTGSLFISSDDGLWFIDQATTNFAGTGTVKAKLVEAIDGLSDLASAYWPEETRLPVRFSNFKVVRVK